MRTFSGARPSCGPRRGPSATLQPWRGGNLCAAFSVWEPKFTAQPTLPKRVPPFWLEDSTPDTCCRLSALSHALWSIASCVCSTSRPALAWPEQRTPVLSGGQNHIFSKGAWISPKFVLAWVLTLRRRVPYRVSLYLAVSLYLTLYHS